MVNKQFYTLSQNGDTDPDCSLIGSLVSFCGPCWIQTVSSLGSGKSNIFHLIEADKEQKSFMTIANIGCR